MSSSKKGKKRKAEVTLKVVANTDDPSILQACVSALKGGPVGAEPPMLTPPATPSRPVANSKRSPVSADVQQLAEDAIDSSLRQVAEELRKSGVEPKFDGTEWGEQLVELWRVLKQLEAEGFHIEAEEIDETAGK